MTRVVELDRLAPLQAIERRRHRLHTVDGNALVLRAEVPEQAGLDVLGQQRLIAWGFTSATLGIADAAVVARQAVLLGATTLAATGLVVLGAWRLLRRDEAVERA